MYGSSGTRNGDELTCAHVLTAGKPGSTVLPSDLRYLGTLDDGTRVLMQPPERFVNSSDCPNTKTIGKSDVAVRAITEGEELTSKYPLKYGPHGELLSDIELDPRTESDPQL